MTDSLHEQLSACLDGQLPEAELDLLLKQVARNGELRSTLGRYSLVGEALRSHGAARASAGFADRVAAAIAADTNTNGHAADLSANHSSRPATRSNSSAMRWLRPAAGAAVAAGVAAVAVFSFQAPSPELAVVAQSPAASTTSDSYIVPANAVSTFVPATRLTNYVVAHSEYSSPLGRRTVLSGVLSEEDEAGAAAANDDEVAAEKAAIEAQQLQPGGATPRQ